MALKKALPKISLDDSKDTKCTAYRIERLDAFTWRAFKVRCFDDGTFSEELVFKEDILDLVTQNVNRAMRSEGQVQFLEKKNVNA